MKKLMIAAAMVCAAALSHGAAADWPTFDWAASSVWFGPKVADFATLEAGQVLNSAVSTDGAANRMQQEAATGEGKLGVQWQMIMTITDAASSETLDPVAFTGYSSAKPKVAGVLKSEKVYLPTGDDTVDFSYTMVIESKYTDANGDVWTLTSNEINGGNVSKGAFDDLSFTTAAVPTKWTVSGGPDPVPEPTSGLLLLLGVAGLALRRKQK